MTDIRSHGNPVPKDSGDKLVEFMGWKGSYALFRIRGAVLPDGSTMSRLIVEHEGNWTYKDGMMCHPEYEFYEDVQDDLGSGLVFLSKKYIFREQKSRFEYLIKDADEAILAVPATGEGFSFSILGVGASAEAYPLIEREL